MDVPTASPSPRPDHNRSFQGVKMHRSRQPTSPALALRHPDHGGLWGPRPLEREWKLAPAEQG
ncbi:hypothetical protein B0T26DRAFT_720101 [Lasiosphaeria miniovina]|uniref:Uncharacterized protein n=1 Tax=Lasiosphaeria miniovina TaxID=1954250 RepID=A0AA40A4B7_9PEZI|nr:uncharacterized protein B0T26DRAFT_720101 [Lasiosphaeria miniovina]KAK0708999.1 hypothetical protein B0T26DRAFT_720101 [Lasiosphaeria miniovina]